jgi:hypothetical protein
VSEYHESQSRSVYLVHHRAPTLGEHASMSASETPTPPNQPADVARQAGQEDSRAVGETKRFYPKTHANFWKSKLEHRTSAVRKLVLPPKGQPC